MFIFKVKTVFMTISVLLFTMKGNSADLTESKVRALVNTIQVSLCKRDTSEAAKLIAQLRKDYPTDGNIRYFGKVLGDIYIYRRQWHEAINILEYSLNYTPTTKLAKIDTTICGPKQNDFLYTYSRVAFSISLSRAYIAIGDFKNSLKYLDLADDKYLDRGCVNGMIMTRSSLSIQFANHYLATGDTSKAIGRLLYYFMLPDGNMAALTRKLKQILLMKYAQTEIIAEVNRAIEHLKIVKGKKGEPERILDFTIFGHTVRQNAHTRTLQQWRETMGKRESIITLLQP